MNIYFDLGSIYALLLSVTQPRNEEGWDMMTAKFGHYYRDLDPHKMVPACTLLKERGPTSKEVQDWKLKLNLKRL